MEQTQIVALIYEHMGKPQDRLQMTRLVRLVEAACTAERPRLNLAANKIERLRSHILAGLQREASFAEQAEKQDDEIERLRAQLAERDRDADRLLEALREAMHQATEYDGLDLATIGPQHWYTKAAAVAAAMAKTP